MLAAMSGEGMEETPRAEAGWYPDPRGSGRHFYWDGEKWTGAYRDPTPPSSGRSIASIGKSRLIIAAGGAALAISPFLPWVQVVLLGNLDLFQLYDTLGRSGGRAWVAVLAGVVIAFVAVRERSPLVWVAAIGVGVVGGVLAIVMLESLLREVRAVHGLATVGLGPYVAVGGCVAMVIGGLIDKGAGSN